ncbi:expressed unknown protein [Seminavis robusta]|uniref:Uncharacterized protein n=1 Tax=Seminavis robusta TaxID=568900 RepID=A0A9N8H4C2_9STRA|nr:expressed unknown protein [Seminavis robusta]|eukprot:Sro6_g005440.1 n/a (317) ;mRNA; f:188630-189580
MSSTNLEDTKQSATSVADAKAEAGAAADAKIAECQTNEATGTTQNVLGKEQLLELDPNLFNLSEEERDRALNIKELVEGLPDLNGLSDLMYANLAVLGDAEWALERAYQMQEVRQEYKIRLTYQDAVQSIKALMELLPLTFLSYSFNLQQAESIMIVDLIKFRLTLWRDPKGFETMMRGLFYLSYATIPSLEIARKGKTDLFECEGFKLGCGMLDVKICSQITCQTVGAFPANAYTKFYHTPVMANVVVSMTKKLVPKEIAEQWEFGCRFAGGRLDKFYLQPTPEIATQRTLANFCEGLKIRMASELVFSLDDDYE